MVSYYRASQSCRRRSCTKTRRPSRRRRRRARKPAFSKVWDDWSGTSWTCRSCLKTCYLSFCSSCRQNSTYRHPTCRCRLTRRRLTRPHRRRIHLRQTIHPRCLHRGVLLPSGVRARGRRGAFQAWLAQRDTEREHKKVCSIISRLLEPVVMTSDDGDGCGRRQMACQKRYRSKSGPTTRALTAPGARNVGGLKAVLHLTEDD
jgi:hypothetical protein